jgi:hypothetical protein
VSIMVPPIASMRLDPSTIFLGFEYMVLLRVEIQITAPFGALD